MGWRFASPSSSLFRARFMATTRAHGVANGWLSHTIVFHILCPLNLAPPWCPVYYPNCVLYILRSPSHFGLRAKIAQNKNMNEKIFVQKGINHKNANTSTFHTPPILFVCCVYGIQYLMALHLPNYLNIIPNEGHSRSSASYPFLHVQANRIPRSFISKCVIIILIFAWSLPTCIYMHIHIYIQYTDIGAFGVMRKH